MSAPQKITQPATDVAGRTIRWLLTDLDGTIVGRDLRLVERSAQAVKEFRRAGGHVVVATGRNEESAGPYYRALGLDTPAILYNGARIVDLSTGLQLLDRTLDEDACAAVWSLMADLAPHLGVVGFSGASAYVLRDAPTLPDYSRRDGIPLLPRSELAATHVFSKIMIIGRGPADLLSPRRVLQSTGLHGRLVQSEQGYLEVLPEGADKGTALVWLANRYGIDLSQVAAIGDNPNDAAMIAAAGLGVAVGGAHPDAIDAADLVVGSCEDGAVAELISHLRLA